MTTITKEDIMEYLKWRVIHLNLERQKVPYTHKPKLRHIVMTKLKCKMDELNKLKDFLNRDFKGITEFEKNKVDYLNKKKIEILKSK